MIFSGNVESDFLKLVRVEDSKKPSTIDYTSQDFSSIKDSLIKYMKAVYPIDFHNFTESDLGIMLVELFAYVGSVNTFQSDYNAHENYLRLAKSRKSVKNLLQLIGVRMKGPISSVADAKVTFSTGIGADYSVTPNNRVVNITSPDDGANLTYTLYKTSNGRLDPSNDSGGFTLSVSESDGLDGIEFSNLVLQEGAFVRETGTFNSTELVKTIPLSQSPLIEGSVEIIVNGDSDTSGSYAQVDNIFFASGSSDKVFQVVPDDDNTGTIVFGDNKIGQSPRDGDSYSVIYRSGGGSRGNIRQSFINADFAGGLGILENTSVGTGGADAESVAHAKRYAPLTFRRQDRLVTLEDIKAFGNSYVGSFGSVGKVTASVRRAYSSGNVIDVFLLEKANDFQLRRGTPQFKLDLLEQMNLKKMLTSEFVILDGLIRTIDLVVSVNVDKELRGRAEVIKAQARSAIQNFFLVDNNDFGKTLVLQDLNRKIFEIDDIRFSTIDNLTKDVPVDFNEIIQLNNLTVILNFV
tara:strand:- start:2753 stop:4315 length:1563 start_codon:yes stop_codon:yes gene_type:complete